MMLQGRGGSSPIEAKSGSVGAAWPPKFDSHNSRIKAFCPFVVHDGFYRRKLFSQLLYGMRDNPDSTRTTARAFVDKGAIESIMGRHPAFDIEARFDADYAVPGCDLVYFASNAPSRLPEPAVLEQELMSVRQMARLARTSPEEAGSRIREGGYSMSHLVSHTESDISQLLALYQEAYQEYTFDLSAVTISQMLNNGNIVIVARDRESNIVSSLIAEHCQLQIEKGPLVSLYELSDYATLRSHRGNGLMTLMQMEAISSIRGMPQGSSAIIYAEDRAPWIAVNKSSQRAGMDYCGTLLQHCVLVSDRDFGEQGRYENLNVWVHDPR